MAVSAVVFIERLDLWRLPLLPLLMGKAKPRYYSTDAWPCNRPLLRRALEILFGLQKLSLSNYPGSYRQFSELAIDHFMPCAMRKPASRRIQDALSGLVGDPQILTALQKVMAERYAAIRARSWVLVNRVAKADARLFYIPVVAGSNDDFISGQDSHNVKYYTPLWVTLYTSLINRLEALASIGYSLLATLFLLLQRGLAVSTPAPKRWKWGLDVYNSGIPWNAPYRETFFTDDNIRQQDVLHVVRNRLLDAKTRAYYQQHGISYVEGSRLRLPLRYFLFRICRQFLLFTTRFSFKALIQPRYLPTLWAANEVLYHHLVRMELLDQAYPTDFFIARDEYGVSHILRTLLHHRRGGRTLGFSHGACLYKQISVSFYTFDTFCFTSPFQKELLQASSTNTERSCHIGVGLYGLDRTYELVRSKFVPAIYRDIKKRYKIVGVLGDEYHGNEEYDFNKRSLLRFCQAAFSLLRRDDLYLILCPKKVEFDGAEVNALIAASSNRATVDKTYFYELLPVFDYALSASITAGLEAIARGCPTLFYDQAGDRLSAIAQDYSQLVVHTDEELWSGMQAMTAGREALPKPQLENFKRLHGLRFDGKVCERFRSQLYDLAKLAGDTRLELKNAC